MKRARATTAILAGAVVMCSSCTPSSSYLSYGTPTGLGAGAAWTRASYDSAGFPIFGYSYGRPVYGYTADGTAIFSIGALTSLCYVPHWGPASWYHGRYFYPRHIHRVPAPPHYPAGHRPGLRPPQGTTPPPKPKPVSPGISTMPMPVPKHNGANFPKPVPVTGNRMQHGFVSSGGGVRFDKPTGVPSTPTRRIGPPASADRGRGNPAISTMPMPVGGVGRPSVSTMPMGGNRVMSIPRPGGVGGHAGLAAPSPSHGNSPHNPTAGTGKGGVRIIAKPH